MKRLLIALVLLTTPAFARNLSVYNPFTGATFDFVRLGSGSSVNYGTLILKDSADVPWVLTLDTTGHLVTTAVSISGLTPPSSIAFLDVAGTTWTLTVTTNGNLMSTQ